MMYFDFTDSVEREIYSFWQGRGCGCKTALSKYFLSHWLRITCCWARYTFIGNGWTEFSEKVTEGHRSWMFMPGPRIVIPSKHLDVLLVFRLVCHRGIDAQTDLEWAQSETKNDTATLGGFWRKISFKFWFYAIWTCLHGALFSRNA